VSKGKSPSARSMDYLRKRGFVVCRVEQRLWIPGAKFPRTRDAFGFGDLLVAKPGWGVALVQVTSTANLSAREVKAKDISALYTWLHSGGRFLLQGWRKGGARGERKTWKLTEREIS
jgi:hypothetical protein